MAGVQHPSAGDLWVFEGPAAILRLPRLVVVYAIDDDAGFVDLWALHRL